MTLMRTALWCLLASATALSCARDVEQLREPDSVLFENARLIVGDGTPAIENSALLVERGVFVAVGRQGSIELPDGALRVDLTGKTVMPALIDGHNHLGYSNARTGTTSWEHYTRAHLIENLERMAYYGVAVSMCLGNDGGHGELPWALRDERLSNAARFLTAGPGISTPGGGQGGERAHSWTTVTSEDEAREAVRMLAPYRPTLIKIWVDDRGGTVEAMPPVIQRAIIDEAHKRNLRVAGHANYLGHVKELVAHGVDGLTHMVRDLDHEVDEELIRMLRARPGVFILPVLPPRGDGDPGYVEADLAWIGETLPPSQVRRLREALMSPSAPAERYTRGARSFSVQARNLLRLKEAGVIRIGFGTDGAGSWTAHTELADMVAAGLTPMEALVAATGTMADILEIEDIGLIESDRSADFLVLNGNPLDDITNTRRIDRVYLRGREVDREGLGRKLSAEPNGE